MLGNNHMGSRRRCRFYHRAGVVMPTFDLSKEHFIDVFLNYNMEPFDYSDEEEFQPTARITAGGKRRINHITVASLHNRLLDIIDSMIAYAEAEDREQEVRKAKKEKEAKEFAEAMEARIARVVKKAKEAKEAFDGIFDKDTDNDTDPTTAQEAAQDSAQEPAQEVKETEEAIGGSGDKDTAKDTDPNKSQETIQEPAQEIAQEVAREPAQKADPSSDAKANE